MLDFVNVEVTEGKRCYIVAPEFIVKKSKDLMIRGHSFYAVWNEETGLWSTNEDDVVQMVDKLVYEKGETVEPKKLLLLKNFTSNKWSEWQKYCKSLFDNYHDLDSRVTFSNTEVKKKDYVSKRLPYPLEEGPIDCYEELISTLYDPKNREKIEWAIGSIVAGESENIQKFFVLYGAPGTGKSTIIDLIMHMFDGYCKVFDSKALSSGKDFSMEMFRSNPLIAVQHDGDLSKLEDNTKINSIVSHEYMVINEKFKAPYQMKLRPFLIMATNKPVKITDAKSGLLRRLIDVRPTGNRIPSFRFNELLKGIKFEYSGIAYHCLKVYEELGINYYKNYIPNTMMSFTNDFYNFIEDNFDFFCENSASLTLKPAWLRYKEYCTDANVPYPLPMRLFKAELQNYYEDFKDRTSDGRRSVYFGFLKDKFYYQPADKEEVKENDIPNWLQLKEVASEFDEICKDCKAQYAKEDDTPERGWDNCKTTLKEIDTKNVHYVRIPENHIVIDFDLKDSEGRKDPAANLKAASEFPKTYAEFSKSGGGLHLHYLYNGDISELSRVYKEGIEVKVFTGKSALRRKLTLCNTLPIAMISSGLPLKEKGKTMLNEKTVKSEKVLREMIIRNLRKEYHPNTKPSMDFIYKLLCDAKESGLKYDVRDLMPDVQKFAMHSTHNADYCMRLLSKMEFASEEIEENKENPKSMEEAPIVIFDVEVFPNLFVIVWKKKGPDNTKVYMYNPEPEEVEALTKMRLVGFNNRNYDNHILYAAMMGYSNEELYKLSQRIIDGDRDAKFKNAYNLSYTDVYDFLSAGNKMGLKKWEIKLHIHHSELGWPWDKPVPKEFWKRVGTYCGYDVEATEAVWDANESDWIAREIMAEWAGMTVNDTTNTLTAKIVVGDDPNPQDKFIYTDLSTIFPGYEFNKFGIDKCRYKPDAKIVSGKSIYMGEDPGEGGRVFAKPGMYVNVALLDVKSMHPSSICVLKIFGEVYTMHYENIKVARVAIKEKRYEDAKSVLPEKLHKYFDDKTKIKQLAGALKTPLNSAYGLTSAKFANKLRDPRNEDNIVAKYGALFMMNLQKEVEKRGFTVAHIKTDSIKIPNATDEIIQFCMDYGAKYGFEFDHEATYAKMCLVNEAVYIALVSEEEGEKLETPYWTATGAQFAVPYVFKTLFSKEPLDHYDYWETRSVTTALYLDMNENLPDVSEYEKEIKKLEDQYKKGTISDTRFESECQVLNDEIAKGHDYRFVGKIGAFCPVVEGTGGGRLIRLNDKTGKYAAVNGTKKPSGGEYRWLECEMIDMNDLWDKIDRSYYDNLVNDAVETISAYGDFEWFVSPNDDPWPAWMNAPEDDEEIPFH